VVGIIETSGGGGELAEAAHSHAAGTESNAWSRHGWVCINVLDGSIEESNGVV
jgi:hypothetical protein